MNAKETRTKNTNVTANKKKHTHKLYNKARKRSVWANV